MCPSFAHEYQGDVWHLLHAGLAGGKGVPATVAAHPSVFVTLTAPSTGPVHTTRTQEGPARRCHPSRRGACARGRPRACHRLHGDDDPALGQPLCPDCFDYDAAVAFNWAAPELWRRFTITLRRTLPRHLGLTAGAFEQAVRMSFVRGRGVPTPRRRPRPRDRAPRRPADGWQPPALDVPNGALADAVRAAAAHVRTTVTLGKRAHVVRYGGQVDVRAITVTGEVTARQVAAYVAKYASKTTDELGLDRPVRHLDDLDGRDLTPHVRRIVETVWALGEQNPRRRREPHGGAPPRRPRQPAFTLARCGHLFPEADDRLSDRLEALARGASPIPTIQPVPLRAEG